MRIRKLKVSDIKQWLPSLFAIFDLWLPRNSLKQETLWARIKRTQNRGQSVHHVACDEAGGNKIVGIISYNREWSLKHGGSWIVSITEFLVQPEYDTPQVRAMLLHQVIRAAIACQAVVVRHLAKQEDVAFFESELFHRPLDRVLMERSLPWEKYKNMHKTSRFRDDKDE